MYIIHMICYLDFSTQTLRLYYYETLMYTIRCFFMFIIYCDCNMLKV